GWLSDDDLRELSALRRVPLYRLEGLVSFYPHFRRQPPALATIQVCRDVTCALAGCESATARVRDAVADREDVEIHAVSCLGRCDAAPAVAVNDVPMSPATLHDLDAVLEAV